MELICGSAIPNTPSLVLLIKEHRSQQFQFVGTALNQFNAEKNSSPKHQVSTWTPDQIPEVIAGITLKNWGHKPQISDHYLISAVPEQSILIMK